MPSMNKVPTLLTIAFYKIVVESWLRIGTFEQIIDYLSIVKDHNIQTSSPFFLKLSKQLQKILDLVCLPRSLATKIGNCLLEFDREFNEFSMEMLSALQVNTRENVEAALRHVIITPDGHINRRQTIVNVALDAKLGPILHKWIIRNYCISFDVAMENLRMQNVDPNETSVETLKELFSDPFPLWQQRAYSEKLEDQVMLCAALYGPTEALKYFHDKVERSERQIQLVRIAMHMSYHRYSVDKILYFYNHLDTNLWLELLRRHFLKIFQILFNSQRYKHMCIVFFDQIKEKLNPGMFPILLNFLTDSSPELQVTFKSVQLELYLADWESTVLSVWRMIPSSHRGTTGVQVFTIINKFLENNRFNSVLAIIEDDTFIQSEREELINSVILNAIVNKNNEFVNQFLEWIRSKSYIWQVSDLIKPNTLQIFMTLGDNLRHISEYNTILLLNLSTNEQIKGFKKTILTNYKFIGSLIEGIGIGVISMENFKNFIMWACSYDYTAFSNYVHTCLMPVNLMGEIYKNFMISTGKSFYSIDVFNLSDKHVQYIRKNIANDTKTLFQYCFDVIRNRRFSALPKMLTSVFHHNGDREIFLREFFRSREGADAISSMLLVPAFDFEFFCGYLFKKTLEDFLEFKKYFVISDAITSDLLTILDGYGDPRALAPCDTTNNTVLYPHESWEAFKKVCDVNLVVLRCCLRESVIVQFLQIAANLG